MIDHWWSWLGLGFVKNLYNPQQHILKDLSEYMYIFKSVCILLILCGLEEIQNEVSCILALYDLVLYED